MLRVPWYSWIPLAAVGTLMALACLWVTITPVADQTELDGRTWVQFAGQDAEVAALYAMDLVILGVLGVGFGLLAAVVAAVPYRQGERWAWFALWLVPLTIGAVAVRMLLHQYVASFVYVAFTLVAVVGLLLATRELMGSRT
jgi:hypothetical protein